MLPYLVLWASGVALVQAQGGPANLQQVCSQACENQQQALALQAGNVLSITSDDGDVQCRRQMLEVSQETASFTGDDGETFELHLAAGSCWVPDDGSVDKIIYLPLANCESATLEVECGETNEAFLILNEKVTSENCVEDALGEVKQDYGLEFDFDEIQSDSCLGNGDDSGEEGDGGGGDISGDLGPLVDGLRPVGPGEPSF